MNILLINDNPVVSRLLALCTRSEHIRLDEVKRVDDMKDVRYDILFVDDASYTDDIDALLDEKSIRKKVFISYDEEKPRGFDQTIKKPFLPSQIMKVIENVDMSDEFEEHVEEDISIFPLSKEEETIEEEVLPDIFPLSAEDDEADDILDLEEAMGSTAVLDSDEIAKIKALLEMDEEIAESEDVISLSDDEYEARKVKVIKEQLIADGLEIVEENEIVEELSTTAPSPMETSDEMLGKKKKREFTPDELAVIEKAFYTTLATLKPKKIKKLLQGKETKIKIKLEDDQ